MQNPIEKAAHQIRSAFETKTPCAPIRHAFENKDVEAAYEIQHINTELKLNSGFKIIGKKIGLTSFAVQNQLGVSEPDYGMLFDDMNFENKASIPSSLLMQAKAETELAFVLKENLSNTSHSIEEIKNAIDYALVAIEIVGSRIENWDITIMDTVADNASASHFVIGNKRINLDDIDLENCQMKMFKNDELVSEGNGSACMGNPLVAVQWLAEKMVELGQPLKKGEVILSGALGPMVNIDQNDTIRASIDDFENVSFKVI